MVSHFTLHKPADFELTPEHIRHLNVIRTDPSGKGLNSSRSFNLVQLGYLKRIEDPQGRKTKAPFALTQKALEALSLTQTPPNT